MHMLLLLHKVASETCHTFQEAWSFDAAAGLEGIVL